MEDYTLTKDEIEELFTDHVEGIPVLTSAEFDELEEAGLEMEITPEMEEELSNGKGEENE